ncbi:MAG: ATP-binding cassette, subfamily bacterial PglK, partial [Patescibacteria group bacterium]|nr:ATP-binding cassette, subfamily bacterial PglK [Patescibacteria group bacterium]
MVMNPVIINESKWLNYFFNFFHFESPTSFMVFAGFVVLGLLVVGNFVSAFATWIKIKFVWRKNHELSNSLLRKYVFMPYAYFLNHNTASLSKNVLMEVNQLTSGYILPLVNIFTGGVTAFVILTVLLYVNLLMTLVAAVVLISMYLSVYLYFSERIRTGGELRLKTNKERFRLAGEALGGVKDIKILGVEKYFLDRYSKHSGIFSEVHSRNQIIGQIPRYIMEVVAFGGIVGLMIFSVSLNMSNQKVIPLVSFFAFAGYRLMPALQELFNALTTMRFNKAVLDKIHKDILENGRTDVAKFVNRNKISPLPFKKNIKLDNVSFCYPNNAKNVLDNITMSIEKNTFVAIIGTTGAGKTTLVDLMLGLLSPSEGFLKVDEAEINEESVKNWQANLGYVPQQIFLTDDTVASNIAFGVPAKEIDLDRLKESARMANIHDFVDSELPNRYDTVIGERGIRLSGGQKQRIGIARALYHDPEILLFDEATSSLDNATEKEVLRAIENVAKTKTMIVIAHRLTTVKNCDKVYVVEKGMIIKEGSYDEIVRKV